MSVSSATGHSPSCSGGITAESVGGWCVTNALLIASPSLAPLSYNHHGSTWLTRPPWTRLRYDQTKPDRVLCPVLNIISWDPISMEVKRFDFAILVFPTPSPVLRPTITAPRVSPTAQTLVAAAETI